MSTLWHALLPAATVGTERHAGALALPAGEIGDLARRAAEAAAERGTGLLRAAAVLATCSAAGAQGAEWTEPLPPAAQPDILPAPVAGDGIDALDWALHEGPHRLQHGALQALAHAGMRLPPRLLPQALDLGRRTLALREPLQAVLGERGRWLAALRADWAFAAGASEAGDAGVDSEAVWTDGTLEQRRAWLVRARRADPAAARARLEATLPELPARERADLAGALQTSLGPDDEPLLDRLRADRSREVRQATLQLLLRLPQAAHARRAAARMTALLARESGLLRRRWVLDAPEAAAADWQADQVDPLRPKDDTLGERGWWLYQLVRQVPLGWWQAHTGMSAPELLAWAAGTDWAEALLRGWTDVLFAAPEDTWCDALLDAWPPNLRVPRAHVLGLLPPARRDRHLLREAQGATTVNAVLLQALQACPHGHVLSVDLSSAFARALQAAARDGQLNIDPGLRSLLPEFACACHPHALGLLETLPHREDATPACNDALHTVERVVRTRRTLITLSPTRTP